MKAFILILALSYIFTLVILGITQPITAIARLIKSNRRDSHYAIGLKRYLALVFIYFYLIYLASKPGMNVPDSIQILYLLVLPMIIAVWYVVHVNTWAKKHKRIEAFDRMQKAKDNHNLLLEVPCQEKLDLDSHSKQKVKLMNWNRALKIAQ